MTYALSKKTATSFISPDSIDPEIKPILAGNWQTTNDGLIHSILHWVDRANPLGASPRNPSSDSQYWLWESGVSSWLGGSAVVPDTEDPEKEVDNKKPRLLIINPRNGESFNKDSEVYVAIQLNNTTELVEEGTVKINGKREGKINVETRSFSFIPSEIDSIKSSGNTLEVEIKGTDGNKFSDTITFGTN
jgi:hypothetical protein